VETGKRKRHLECLPEIKLAKTPLKKKKKQETENNGATVSKDMSRMRRVYGKVIGERHKYSLK